MHARAGNFSFSPGSKRALLKRYESSATSAVSCTTTGGKVKEGKLKSTRINAQQKRARGETRGHALATALCGDAMPFGVAASADVGAGSG